MEKSQRIIRPVATIGFTYMLALTAACYLPIAFSALLFIICFAVSFCISLFKHSRSPRALLILLTAGIAFGIYAIYTPFHYTPALELDGKRMSISAEITDVTTSNSGKAVLTVKLDRSVIQTPVSVKADIYLDEPGDFRPADRISGIVSFYLPSEAYGTATPLLSAKADGIFLYGNATAAELTVTHSDGFSISALLYDLRLSLQEQANRLFSGEDAAVFQGMLLGNSSELSDKTYRDFVHTGILHVMVVSGLHLAILSQFLIRTLKRLGVRRKHRYLVGMAVIPLFMAVAGFTPSVNRAGVMLLLLYAAKLLDRDSDALTSIGLVGLVCTLFSPYLVTDLSFQLTYLSTLGILLLSDRMSKSLIRRLKSENRLLSWLADMLCVTIAAQVFTLPVAALRFKALPILSPIFNLLLSPLFTVILTLGLLLLLFSFIPFFTVIAEVAAAVVSLLIDLVRGAAAFCTSIPFSYLPLGYRFVYFWIIASILLVVFAAFKCNFRHRYPIAALFFALSLGCAFSVHELANRDVLTVAACTQGEETAVMLAYRDQMILLDANKLALGLTEETFLHRIPFISEQEDLALIAAYAEYYQIDTVCTDSIVPEGTISCREVFEPTDATLSFTIPLQMKMTVREDKVYYRISYGNVNLIYGDYDQTLESLYEENKENIYILTNDCNSAFQKPIKYAIMVNNSGSELKKQNPDVVFIDGTKQGITPVKLRPNGDIKIKGAGEWLY